MSQCIIGIISGLGPDGLTSRPELPLAIDQQHTDLPLFDTLEEMARYATDQSLQPTDQSVDAHPR